MNLSNRESIAKHSATIKQALKEWFLQELGTWLVDGGIVNPVPVSLCRAMGADVVVAVNLNRWMLQTGSTKFIGGLVEEKRAARNDNQIPVPPPSSQEQNSAEADTKEQKQEKEDKYVNSRVDEYLKSSESSSTTIGNLWHHTTEFYNTAHSLLSRVR
mgnify:CR=1 FL=1